MNLSGTGNDKEKAEFYGSVLDRLDDKTDPAMVLRLLRAFLLQKRLGHEYFVAEDVLTELVEEFTSDEKVNGRYFARLVDDGSAEGKETADAVTVAMGL